MKQKIESMEKGNRRKRTRKRTKETSKKERNTKGKVYIERAKQRSSEIKRKTSK